MSQFRGRARIVIDVASIRRDAPVDAEAELQTRLTCGHEYGHMIAEMLAVLGGRSAVLSELAQRWQSAFGSNEEEFAEDLGRHLALDGQEWWMGWQCFLVDLGQEMRKVLA